MRKRRGGDSPHVCIIVQNLPVPFDRRVWLECQAIRDAGFEVSVVCPKGPGDPGYQVLDGVHLYKYKAFPPVQRKVAFVGEYVYAFVRTVAGLLRAWRRRPFDVVQTCNPPDIFWAAVWPFKALRGVRFVFDQHDLCPEVYLSRFPDGHRIPHRGLLLLEKATYRLADHVIATNESYRQNAISRGGKSPDEVTVVRTGPDPHRLTRREPEPELRRGHEHLVCYLGVMAPQDGVDIVIRAAHEIVHRRNRTDVAFTLIGAGDSFDDLQALARELDVEGHVEFTGRAPDDLVARLLSTASLGLSPDPKNPLNDVSTMNKTMEYMAFELPVVAFDLVETRVSAADAAVYAEPNVVERYADAILELLDDEARRKEMGRIGRQRVEDVLAWSHQAPNYVSVYEKLMASR